MDSFTEGRLDMNEFEDVLNGIEKDGEKNQRRSFATGMRVQYSKTDEIGVRKIKMKSYKLKKTGLNSCMVKRIVLSDNIRTEAYGLHDEDPPEIVAEFIRQQSL